MRSAPAPEREVALRLHIADTFPMLHDIALAEGLRPEAATETAIAPCWN